MSITIKTPSAAKWDRIAAGLAETNWSGAARAFANRYGRGAS